jgi:hypothetical protein
VVLALFLSACGDDDNEAPPPAPTATTAAVPATATKTLVPTLTATAVPTRTSTPTAMPPTRTATAVTPTAAPTNTPMPATATPTVTRTVAPALGVTNVRALHRSSSAQYDLDCLKCHADIVNEQSLNPQIPGAHAAMLPMFGGAANTACTFCHKAVDFDGQSAANVRRNVSIQLCANCHTAGPGNQYYQSTK